MNLFKIIKRFILLEDKYDEHMKKVNKKEEPVLPSMTVEDFMSFQLGRNGSYSERKK